jgi:hypothetical protein
MSTTAILTIFTLCTCGAGKPKPYTFLGLTEQQERKIRDDNPQSAVGDVVAITKVEVAKHDEYLKMKKAGKVTAEDRHAGFVYFATEVSLCVPFLNGSEAMVTQTQRYKASVPAKK